MPVYTYKSAIELRPSWWRHPIQRWRLRHLLPDMEAQEALVAESVSPEFLVALREAEERAFIYGLTPDSDEGKVDR